MESIFGKNNFNYAIETNDITTELNFKSDNENIKESIDFKIFQETVEKVLSLGIIDPVDFHMTLRAEMFKCNFTLDIVNSTIILFRN